MQMQMQMQQPQHNTMLIIAIDRLITSYFMTWMIKVR